MKFIREYVYPRLILDFVTFYPPLMLLGVLAAGLSLNFEVLLGFIINYSLLVIAFVYNDFVDRKEDEGLRFKPMGFIEHIKHNLSLENQDEGTKRFVNPFVKEKNIALGLTSIFLLSIISILLTIYISDSFMLLGLVISNIIVGFFYSGFYIRLKGLPILDLLSHAYLLAGIQLMFFMAYDSAELNIFSWMILVGAIIYSFGGDLWNEIRDFYIDQQHGIKNSANLFGEKLTNLMSKLFAISGIVIALVGVAGKIWG